MRVRDTGVCKVDVVQVKFIFINTVSTGGLVELLNENP